jgi:hypothetical protein
MYSKKKEKPDYTNEDNQNINSANNVEKRVQRIVFNDEIDAKYGFLRYKSPVEKIGWLINMQPVNNIPFSMKIYPLFKIIDFFFLMLLVFF